MPRSLAERASSGACRGCACPSLDPFKVRRRPNPGRFWATERLSPAGRGLIQTSQRPFHACTRSRIRREEPPPRRCAPRSFLARASRIIVGQSTDVPLAREQSTFLARVQRMISVAGEPVRSRWRPEPFAARRLGPGSQIIEQATERDHTQPDFARRPETRSPRKDHHRRPLGRTRAQRLSPTGPQAPGDGPLRISPPQGSCGNDPDPMLPDPANAPAGTPAPSRHACRRPCRLAAAISTPAACRPSPGAPPVQDDRTPSEGIKTFAGSIVY